MCARLVAVTALVVSWFAGMAVAQEIHLKTRDIQAGAARGAVGSSDTHQLIEFDHTPDAEDLDALLAQGARLVSVVPDNSVVVALPGSLVALGPGIRSVARIDGADKLSPTLAGMAEPLTAMVEFHPDVSVDQQDAVALAEGVSLERPAVLLANHAIVTGTFSDLDALAAHDEVAYIFPADPALLTDSGFSPCAGMLTLSGPIGQSSNLVHGWSLDSDHLAHLSYFFGTLTPKVTPILVRSEVLRALNTWSQYTGVVFQAGTSATAARTVAIEFASGAHGDAYPFDSHGAILAHTFYPVPLNPESIAGDMHLNADENWQVGPDVDIYSVALHEAGHALGLGHTDNPGDVMYPYYRRGMHLSSNDIAAVQSLYGAPASAVPVTTSSASAALRIGLDSAPASTQNTQVTLTGAVSGGTAPYSVQWQTDHGAAGPATVGGGSNFTAFGIPLVNGSNTVSVTVFDSGQKSATQSTAVSLVPVQSGPAAGSLGAPVSVTISAPTANLVTVNSSAMSLAGTASGAAGIARITWQTSNGATGLANGTTRWTVAAVPLLTGTNTVVVRAYDMNGANAWAALVAVKN